DVLGCRGDARQPDHQRVAEENLRKRLPDNRLEAGAPKTLRSMLTRGAGSEIRVDEEDGRPAVLRVVERVHLAFTCGSEPIVLEQMRLEALERDRFQKTRRHDPIGVDVASPHWQRPAFDVLDAFDRHHRTPAGVSLSSSRTSVTWPAMAA